jgi:hypothetical protein
MPCYCFACSICRVVKKFKNGLNLRVNQTTVSLAEDGGSVPIGQGDFGRVPGQFIGVVCEKGSIMPKVLDVSFRLGKLGTLGSSGPLNFVG